MHQLWVRPKRVAKVSPYLVNEEVFTGLVSFVDLEYVLRIIGGAEIVVA